MSGARAALFVVAGLLAGCHPSTEEKAQRAEERRIECLDKICEGDVLPPHDAKTDAVLKIGGSWFVGPRAYFSSANRAAYFQWWDHKPLSSLDERPEVLQNLAKQGRSGEISIDIHLRSHDGSLQAPSSNELLMNAEAEGRVIGKSVLKPGLEVWRVRDVDSSYPTDWYVATGVQGTDGMPPILFCRNTETPHGRCTTGFVWQPGIAVDMRLRAPLAIDWPEIHQEAVRVLQLLRKG